MLARECTQACILGMSLPSPAVAVHILRHLTSVSSLFYYYTCGMSSNISNPSWCFRRGF